MFFDPPTESRAWRFILLTICLMTVRPYFAAGEEARTAIEPRGDVAVQAEEGTDRNQEIGEAWVRTLRDDKGQPTALQTAIVRYVPDREDRTGPVVDLIGAVHVGDRDYYTCLNLSFEDYDALLYELVVQKGVRIERGRGTSNLHPVGAVQNMIKEWLELEHQLEQIDYTKENFVHADMTPEEFAKSMADRGESFLQIMFRLVGQSIAQQSKLQAKGDTTDIDLLAALIAKDRALRLKSIMANQFESMESILSGFAGPEGSTLIEGRNEVALRVLAEQIRRGKSRLGIFYGAGHLSHMGKRLREEFHLKPVEIRWITAWDLRPRDS